MIWYFIDHLFYLRPGQSSYSNRYDPSDNGVIISITRKICVLPSEIYAKRLRAVPGNQQSSDEEIRLSDFTKAIPYFSQSIH
jgi:hypothetical protein